MNRISLSSSYLLFGVLATSALLLSTTDAFTFPSSQVGCSKSATAILATRNILRQEQSSLFMAGDDTDGSGSSGVVELADDDEDDKPAAAGATTAAPFLSQGESMDLEEALNPDLSDPKQTRVILYIIISLVPVLFLVPLMLGSRDLIPLESLPPVDL